ncbi:MAG: protein phosphatase CheZ [Rhodospirillaceae bacterium]|nr:protein phosphatase CheZ [Rhodospirillaceae bacterium]
MSDPQTRSQAAAPGADTASLMAGIRDLSTYIAGMKREIANISPDQMKSTLIDPATNELDATVEATAAATNTIMDVAEKLMELSGQIPGDHGGKVMDYVTQIFEACTFQDITGQRIRKVITAMRAIEERIAGLAKLVEGVDLPAEAPDKPKLANPFDQSGLLNGPQMAGKGHSQASIDELFSSGS